MTTAACIEEVDEQSAYYSSQLKKLSDRRRQFEDLYRELLFSS